MMSHKTEISQPQSIVRFLIGGLPTISVLAIMGGGWMLMHHINSAGGRSEESSQLEPPVTEPETTEVNKLVLPEGKLKAGKFESIAVQPRVLQHLHIVPGRLRYDESRHIDVKAPMNGILTELVVTPGAMVEAGQLLAVITSPEIGQARAEVLRLQQQRQIANKVLEREQAIAENLNGLASLLEQGLSADAIEVAFKDKPLGSYRHDILSSYAKMQLAEELAQKARPLVESGALSGRNLLEREHERQLANTAFRTARDQANFAAQQAKLKAEAELAEADRQIRLALQAVEALLGHQEENVDNSLPEESELSRLEVRAPFAGSVESLGYAENERVMRSDALLVLANTNSLFVEASIRENDWSAITNDVGTTLKVSVPAMEDRVFDAKVRYFGRAVQAETNSVPLVATLDNREGHLRPGMFVRVSVPISPPREALAVKPESIIQHENQEFVFVDLRDGTFQRVDVEIGQVSEDWVEITSGLSPGQWVVTQGAFLLKSELLLQGEDE